MKRCAVVEDTTYSQQFPYVGQQCYRSDDSGSTKLRQNAIMKLRRGMICMPELYGFPFSLVF
jgi:hypothetical protein